jgi:hypothetical protein
MNVLEDISPSGSFLFDDVVVEVDAPLYDSTGVKQKAR